MDPEWREAGGDAEVFSASGATKCTLPPLLPPSKGVRQVGNVTSVSDFWMRCRLVKRHMERALRHPLLVEMCELASGDAADMLRVASRKWDTVQWQATSHSAYPM